MNRTIVALLLMSTVACADAALPAVGSPSAAARAKSTFATTFYVMHWNKPQVFKYSYDAGKGEL